ncbi:MAG: HlyD family efflux transporter periplasmic adaptor subunit [Gemmataceae bacterium]|nr:HlyD family efflux transporter periplasmic adaptor subunit [Gemmataceae bacterium]
MKKLIVIVLLLAAASAVGTALYARYGISSSAPTFRTAEVSRGDLLVTISATGTVEPEEVVDVGAQVLGRVIAIGPDALAVDPNQRGKRIDYTSQVEEGTILAEIDNAIYLAQRNAAKAALERAKADLEQLKAKRDLAAADWRRAQELRNMKRSSLVPAALSKSEPPREIKAIAESDYDLARFNFGVAEANVKVGEAIIVQEEASLQLAETNLSYTVIKSPVKGTIIDRRVNIGQTVVASLNAPSLFLIAKDLRRMEVWASVNEADIGQLKIGMPVRFKVDAHPKRMFHGKIAQIRLNANMTQNVVTYTVVVSAENPELKLLPYMTADVKFEVAEHHEVLVVPNGAVRWQPRPEQIVPGFDDDAEPDRENAPHKGKPPHGEHSSGERGTAATPDATTAKDAAPPLVEQVREERREADRGRVWVSNGHLVRPIDVRIGSSDGAFTEISSEGIHEGLVVIVGQARVEASAEAANPFVPKFPRRSRR